VVRSFLPRCQKGISTRIVGTNEDAQKLKITLVVCILYFFYNALVLVKSTIPKILVATKKSLSSILVSSRLHLSYLVSIKVFLEVGEQVQRRAMVSHVQEPINTSIHLSIHPPTHLPLSENETHFDRSTQATS